MRRMLDSRYDQFLPSPGAEPRTIRDWLNAQMAAGIDVGPDRIVQSGGRWYLATSPTAGVPITARLAKDLQGYLAPLTAEERVGASGNRIYMCLVSLCDPAKFQVLERGMRRKADAVASALRQEHLGARVAIDDDGKSWAVIAPVVSPGMAAPPGPAGAAHPPVQETSPCPS